MPEFPGLINITHIGEGAFGQIYKGFHKIEMKEYVVKQIKFTEKFTKEDAMNEAVILANLSDNPHENVIKYKDSYLKDNEIFIIMEYCAKGTLQQLIDEKKISQKFPVDEQIIKDILFSSLKALNHLHQLNIIHRDIKPTNIFLDESGKIKLGDLGVSRKLID